MMEPAVAPPHSPAFIRPIQCDGADDNDSSCTPPPTPTLKLPLPLSPDFLMGSHFLSFFVPAFFSVTLSRLDIPAAHSRIGRGVKGREFSVFDTLGPLFLPLRHFLACSWFCFSVPPTHTPQLIVPFSNPSSMLLSWHRFKAPVSQRKNPSTSSTRLTISMCLKKILKARAQGAAIV